MVSVFVLAVAAVFELLLRAEVSELSVLGLKVKDYIFIQKLLPAIFSFLLYETIALNLTSLIISICI